MSRIIHPIRRLLDRIQARFRQSRPGSVLIMVVALLVLMALIGTAYITTARTDRYSAQQNAFNTEIDLLVQGVVDMSVATIVQDSGQIDSPSATKFLADRVPRAQNFPYWPNVTAALTGTPFESPYYPGGQALKYRYIERSNLQPRYIDIPTPQGTKRYPAFGDPQTNQIYLAGDADGDGIADSGLWPLPIGQINGVTYYAAVRIIDNGSALNVNTAWKFNDDWSGYPAQLPGDFFPTNVNLQDSIRDDSLHGQMAALNYYRSGSIGNFSTKPVQESFGSASGIARNDFIFVSHYDAMWQQLGRRLLNPGFNTITARCQALPISESAALAYRFCLHNPNASASLVEQALHGSLYDTTTPFPVPWQPYSPDQQVAWYANNFAYDQESAGGNLNVNLYRPRRALLTARNPVNNLVPSNTLRFRGLPQDNPKPPFLFGDWVVTSDGRTYVCIQPTNQGPKSGGDDIIWSMEPWYQYPTKTSVNTANFGALWVAFAQVMSDPSLQGVVGYPQTPPVYAQNRMFRSSIRSQSSTPQAAGANPPAAGGLTLSPRQMLRLRSALAAVNTLDLRDSDDNVSSHHIVLPADLSVSGPAHDHDFHVMIYGTEKQPYITEVYAHNKGGGAPNTGYMAIELYNPFEVPISLQSWQLGTIDRTQASAGVPNLTVTPVNQTLWMSAATAPIIKPKQYIVLASSAVPPPNTGALSATVGNTVATASTLYIVPELATLPFNHELMLFKPRIFNGLPSQATDSTGFSYNEGNIPDMVPVDSYDFTGLMLEDQSPAGYQWHYVRPNNSSAAAGKAWHFVYPGIYGIDAAGAGGGGAGGANGPIPRLRGTETFAGNAAGVNLMSFGLPDATLDAIQLAGYGGTDVPIQLNNTDFGGPNKQGIKNNGFPFGQFARNGDMLQIPFIGAYKIWIVVGNNAQIVEINPVTMDSAYADSGDHPSGENIGRFCPINPNDTGGQSQENDYANAVTGWRYHWALSLFDYLSVFNPQDDYFPNVDPTKYPGGPIFGVANVDPKVVNSQFGAALGVGDEEFAPIDGLVNINTAPLPVLAALPFTENMSANRKIAQAIVRYRDTNPNTPNPPFTSIFQLNMVPGFRDLSATGSGIQIASFDPDDTAGDISPLNATLPPPQNGAPAFDPTDHVLNDFETQNLMLTRISNQITLRSDSFTVYVLVQGWRNAATASPELVVQRRAAVLVDRTAYTGQNKVVSVTNIPNN